MLRRVADLRSDYLSDNLDFLVDNVRQNIIRLPRHRGRCPVIRGGGEGPRNDFEDHDLKAASALTGALPLRPCGPPLPYDGGGDEILPESSQSEYEALQRAHDLTCAQAGIGYGAAAMHCTSSRSPGTISAEMPIVALV
jgi:hypothetical protein